ncbi:hypothetical protein ACS15_4217 [Ralstonia insidiosa]|uniref:Uncharacterized protein n=1 Tax=Ralstonia insidiosa TaxID=190721 RepID=A0AAC9BLR9_9RALS|nr:hypothetical protein ACS15_4217 [Ralstonia insidiosa]
MRCGFHRRLRKKIRQANQRFEQTVQSQTHCGHAQMTVLYETV